METIPLPLYTTVVTTTKISDTNPHRTLETALNAIFPTSTQETKQNSVKRNLGETGKTLSEEQINALAADFQYLIDTWLDEFEEEVFEGKKLQEILGGNEYGKSTQE